MKFQEKRMKKTKKRLNNAGNHVKYPGNTGNT